MTVDILTGVASIFFMALTIPCVFAFALSAVAMVISFAVDITESRKRNLLKRNGFSREWLPNKPMTSKWRNDQLNKQIYEYEISALKYKELLNWIEDGKSEN